MSDRIPDGAIAYKRTAIFDQDTIPQALTRTHSTKAGVWGKLHVLDGSLVFVSEPPKGSEQAGYEQIVRHGETKVIMPEASHHVRAKGPVRFFVEFYRLETRAGETW